MAAEEPTNPRPAIDAALVRRLGDTQFPQWAGLPLRLLSPAGSDHVIYRLGDGLSVRLPRHAGAIGQAGKESEWLLPRLAPHLPLPVPVPAGVGERACDLTIAFTLMSARSRAALRTALAADDATWTRGRGRPWPPA